MTCSLCRANRLNSFSQNQHRVYLRCERCDLIQVPAEFHLSLEDEKSHYGTHENNPDDLGYRAFLDRLCEPLAALLRPQSSGLDFGCGPGPTLCKLMEERGHKVFNYDPHFSDDPSALEGRYDFVTMTEVVEHLRDPAQEIVRAWGLLNDSGYLAVMTQMTDEVVDFDQWYYQRDPTHICFWSKSTMRWLASNLHQAKVSFPGAGLCFLQKVAV